MAHSFHYTVAGRVQGVFFRNFTRETAKELGIVGYVKNDAIGTVSGVAQGDQAALDKFKDALSKGPRHARVTEVKLTQQEEINQFGYSTFDIAR